MSRQDRLRRFLEWLGPRRDGPRLVARIRPFLSLMGDEETRLDPAMLRTFLASVSAGNQRHVREAVRRWLHFRVTEERLSPESARPLLNALRKEPPRRVSSVRSSPQPPVSLGGEWPELLRDYRLELRRRLRDWKPTFRRTVRFMLYLERTGKAVAEVRASLLEAYFLTLQEESLRERGRVLHPRTLRQHLVDIRRWMAHLSRDRVWQDPTRQLELPRIPRRLPRALTYPQVKRLLELPDPLSPLGLRDRAFLELLYGCGLRRGELQRLNLLDLDLEQTVLTIRREKSGGGRVAPLGRWVLHHLETYLAHGRPQLESSPGEPALWLSQYGNRLGRARRRHSHHLRVHVGIGQPHAGEQAPRRPDYRHQLRL